MFDEDVSEASPAVFGAEYAGMEEDELPGPVYIATQRVGAQDTVAQVELRQDDAGRLAMLAYSTHEELVERAGEGQAWIAVPKDNVHQVQQDCGAQAVLWDVELPDGLRHGGVQDEEEV